MRPAPEENFYLWIGVIAKIMQQGFGSMAIGTRNRRVEVELASFRINGTWWHPRGEPRIAKKVFDLGAKHLKKDIDTPS
jgi:hypothetical protein